MTRVKTNSNLLNSRIHEIKKLFIVSSEMADFSEEILESRAEYTDEFIEGLTKSADQVKKGKTFKVDSLAELI